MNNQPEIGEMQPVEKSQTFSNSDNKPKKVENNQEKLLTPEEQDAYIQEMENLLNDADDGNDIIIKDAENEASDLKEIIFKDDFDMTVEEDTTSANVEPDY
jgi:hypothetical protein